MLFSGGNVTFDLKNDGPTLTAARATFAINLNFPPNQTVLPGGQVVWAENCTVDGRRHDTYISILSFAKSKLFFIIFYYGKTNKKPLKNILLFISLNYLLKITT